MAESAFNIVAKDPQKPKSGRVPLLQLLERQSQKMQRRKARKAELFLSLCLSSFLIPPNFLSTAD